VYGGIDGEQSLTELARRCEMSIFDTTQAIFQLCQSGHVQILLAQQVYEWGYKSTEHLINKIHLKKNPAEVRDNYKTGVHQIVRALYNLEIPLIAAVNGAAVGLGCDVACMADIRISADNAKYGVTFLKLGLIPGDGGAWLLPRVIGMSRACELLFTGNLIDAKTALEWGLVSKVVPGDQLMGEAMALAQSIAKQPPQSLRVAKQLLRHGTQANYDTIMEMSAAAQGLMHHTKDHEEGVAAILEKREPVFKGE
jgi:2-(1,2-epoxy-1,2-dihydrophenyl)acetyl-CoA isomerase